MLTSFANLSDKALLSTLQQTCFDAKRLLAKLLVLLIEVEDRELYLHEAYPSLFAYCRRELHMSESEAYRRINAARLVRRFPKLLPRIAQGDIHLSALAQLRDHFNDANLDHLVDAAKGRNKLEISELIARMAPRPGVPSRIRKIPQYDKRTRVTRGAASSIEALAEALYRLQVTGDRAFRDKLFRARDMMMHSNPSGDLSVVIERALDRLIDALEKQRYGKLSRKSTDVSVEPTTTTNDASKAKASSGDRAQTAEAAAEPARPGLARASHAKPSASTGEPRRRRVERALTPSPAARTPRMQTRKPARAAGDAARTARG